MFAGTDNDTIGENIGRRPEHQAPLQDQIVSRPCYQLKYQLLVVEGILHSFPTSHFKEIEKFHRVK